MKKDVIAFRVEKENLDFIKKQPNQQEFLNSVIEAIRNGDLVQKKTQETNHQLDLQIKSAKLDNLRLDAQIKKRKLAYMDTFGVEPSRQGLTAIEKGVRQTHYSSTETYNSAIDEAQRLPYVPSNSKTAYMTHFCKVENREVTLDPYKNVFCPKCGVSV